TTGTQSCLASVSKPLTALAVMTLAEKGRLDYDDPVAKYVPDLPAALGTATLRQLLHHTSGIPDYEHMNVEHPGMTNAEVVAALGTVDKPLFPHGQKYQYCNSGYVLLGQVVEKVSGRSLPDYLREHIFRPAGMTATFVLTAADRKTAAAARGYDGMGKPD